MTVKAIKTRDELPKTAGEGDVYLVEEIPPRHYVYKNGIWHHERNYVSPVRANDLYHEPNV